MKSFASAIIADVQTLGSEFFSANAGARSKQMEKALGAYPKALERYLATVEEKDFLKDTKELVLTLKSAKKTPNSFLTAVGTFVAENAAEFADNWYAGLAGQKKSLEIGGKTMIGSALKELAGRYSEEEFVNRLFNWAKFANGAERIIVQTAAALDAKEKKKIRENFGENIFVIFLVTPNVLGGMRLFTPDGLIDASWRQKIEKLTTISSY